MLVELLSKADSAVLRLLSGTCRCPPAGPRTGGRPSGTGTTSSPDEGAALLHGFREERPPTEGPNVRLREPDSGGDQAAGQKQLGANQEESDEAFGAIHNKAAHHQKLFHLVDQPASTLRARS